MRPLVSLQELHPGESAIVEELLVDGFLQTRLLDLGFTKGSQVSCLFASALGDPRAYGVRGTVIALRKADACRVRCQCREEMS